MTICSPVSFSRPGNTLKMTAFTLALAQTNPTVGDVRGNLAKIRAARLEAMLQGADLVLTTELVTSGYPPEDLVLKPAFQAAIHAAVMELVTDGGPDLLLSTPWVIEGKLYSAILLISGGAIAAVRLKHDLPNYGPFDEKRVFTAGPLPEPILWRGISLGVPVCEDIWTPKVCAHLAGQGAEIFLVANGSPYEHGKIHVREGIVSDRARECAAPMVYLNQVGGQDELVFDGGVLIADKSGQIIGRGPHWQEAVFCTSFAKGEQGWTCTSAPNTPQESEVESIYHALVTGLRDYVEKNHFPGVVLGMSGGVDSALCAALAADALGADRVRCVMMPSPYTSKDSLEDAEACAKALGCPYESISIGPAMDAYEAMLKGTSGTTAENIQARARGMTLMAISNSTGAMVLSTGNKSEMSVGYATLYGDMCGGFAVLKDVYKMTVYELCRWRNRTGEVIPERILTKAPTAELRPGQTDQDSLPPYPVLDGILKGLIEQERSAEELEKSGYARDTVLKIWKMLDRAEYKRRQSAPGVKITPRSFGKDRRYPITNGFTDIATC